MVPNVRPCVREYCELCGGKKRGGEGEVGGDRQGNKRWVYGSYKKSARGGVGMLYRLCIRHIFKGYAQSLSKSQERDITFIV